MTDTFTFVPDVNPTATGNLRQRTAQFGDGYDQAVADGLNTDVQTWPLTFTGVDADIQPILDFIRSHVGQRFLWTPPLGVQGYWRCKTYNCTPNGAGWNTLVVTLTQSSAP